MEPDSTLERLVPQHSASALDKGAHCGPFGLSSCHWRQPQGLSIHVSAKPSLASSTGHLSTAWPVGCWCRLLRTARQLGRLPATSSERPYSPVSTFTGCLRRSPYSKLLGSRCKPRRGSEVQSVLWPHTCGTSWKASTGRRRLTPLQGLPPESTSRTLHPAEPHFQLRSSNRAVRSNYPQRTDCTSTGGLVSAHRADAPDTNRSARPHSFNVVCPRKGYRAHLPPV